MWSSVRLADIHKRVPDYGTEDVADSAIVIGAVLLALSGIRREREA